MYRVLIDDINLNLGDLPGSMEFLYEMLRNRPELAETQDFRDEIVLQLKPEYIPAEEKEYRHLTEEQINVMCAKHLLWLYDEGGEQADFSDCDLSDVDLSHRNLNNAVLLVRGFAALRFRKQNCALPILQAHTWTAATQGI